MLDCLSVLLKMYNSLSTINNCFWELKHMFYVRLKHFDVIMNLREAYHFFGKSTLKPFQTWIQIPREYFDGYFFALWILLKPWEIGIRLLLVNPMKDLVSFKSSILYFASSILVCYWHFTFTCLLKMHFIKTYVHSSNTN